MLKIFKLKRSYLETPMEQVGGGGNDGGDKPLSESPHGPLDNSALKARLRQLESENLKLKKKLWRLQYRGTLGTSIVLLGAGAACLLISYLLSSSILTFTGLGVTLWGILIFYLSTSRHVPEELIKSIFPSLGESTRNLLKTMGYTGELIFFHPRSFKGLGQGYIFIPHYVAKIDSELNSKNSLLNLLPYNLEAEVPRIFLDPRGIFLAAPSQGLVDLFEEKLNVNFAMVDLSYIQKTLPSLMIEQLKLADEFTIEDKSDGTYEVTVVGALCVRRNEMVGKQNQSNNHSDCPFCGANALVISKVIGSPITIKEINVTGQTIRTLYQKLSF